MDEKLLQSLRDLVATSNSGVYATEEELMSKFPELQGYDVQVLRDFVATSNSGKYATEDELLSKFPEFGKKKGQINWQEAKEYQVPIQASAEDQRKDGELVSSLEESSSVSPTPDKRGLEEALSTPSATPLVEIPKETDFNKALSQINADLINDTEEPAKRKLDYLFSPLGFKFEESSILGDAITVTAPNGEKQEFNFDPYFGAEGEAESLRSFISENAQDKNASVSIEERYRKEGGILANKDQAEEGITQIAKKEDELNKKFLSYAQEKYWFDKEVEKLRAVPTSQRDEAFQKNVMELQKQEEKLVKESELLQNEAANFEERKKELNRAVGRYAEYKEKDGSAAGVLYNSWWSGVGRKVSGAVSLALDAVIEFSDVSKNVDYKERVIKKAKDMGLYDDIEILVRDDLEFNQEQLRAALGNKLDKLNAAIKDDIKKQTKYDWGTIDLARKTPKEILGVDVSEEYERKFKEGFFGGAVAGLIESMPTMLGGPGSSGLRVAQMFLLTSDFVDEEMANNPAFKDVSENEKLLIKSSIGAVGAVLEEFGLRSVMKNSGLMNRIIMKALGKATTNTTAKTFGDLVRTEVKSMIGRGLLTTGGAALAEFETGAAQQASENIIKNAYNDIKDRNLFVGPNGEPLSTWTDGQFYKDVLYSGAQEAVGGFIMGTIPGVAAAVDKPGFEGMSDSRFKLFKALAIDEKAESAFVTDLKNQINSDKITVEQAKKTLNEYRRARSLMGKVPDGLSLADQKKAMDLLAEKENIEAAIKGKDESLTKKQRNKIQDINQQLEKLSDAVQEQSTDEVPVQPETTVSEEVEERVPETEPQVATEETEEEEVVEEEVTEEEVTEPTETFDFDNVEGYSINELQSELDNQIKLGEKALPQDISGIRGKIGLLKRTIEAKAKAEAKELEATIEGEAAPEPTPAPAPAPAPAPKTERIESEIEKRLGIKTETAEEAEQIGKDIEAKEQELSDLQDQATRAQRRIGQAKDADAAIKEFNDAKKKVEGKRKEIEDIKEARDKRRTLSDLIFDEYESREKDGDRYQFEEEFNQDPRLAALKQAEEMIEFLKEEGDTDSIPRYEKEIAILEESLKETPPKPAPKPKAEPAPKKKPRVAKDDDLSSVEKSLEKDKDGKFKPNVYVSELVSKPVKDFLNFVVKSFGNLSNYNVLFLTEIDITDDQLMNNLDIPSRLGITLEQFKKDTKGKKGSKVFGFMAGMGAPYSNSIVIFLNNDAMASESKSLDTDTLMILAHELGHAIEISDFANAPEKLKKAITKEYENWLVKVKKLTRNEAAIEARGVLQQYLRDIGAGDKKVDRRETFVKYLTNFNEWFADRVANYMFTQEKPKNAVEKFFFEVAEKFKKLISLLKESNPNFNPVEDFPAMKDFLDGIFRPNAYAEYLAEEQAPAPATEPTTAPKAKTAPVNPIQYNMANAVPAQDSVPPKGTMEEVIRQGRALGYNDASIKELLKSRGYKVKDIDQALRVFIDPDSPMPSQFNKIDGTYEQALDMFNEIRAKLSKFAFTEKEGKYPSMAEVRAKGIELLTNHPLFQAQDESTQMQMTIGFDRSLNTRAGVRLNQLMKDIRERLKERKAGEKELRELQVKLRNLIRNFMPTSKYSKADIDSVLSMVTKLNKDNYVAVTDKVMTMIDKKMAQRKKSLMKEILTLVTKKAKAAISPSGKRRSKGLDAEGQSFFSAIRDIVEASITQDEEALNRIAKDLEDKEDQINDAIEKESKGEELTQKESRLLSRALAYDMFVNINDMSTQDIENLLEDLKTARSASIAILKSNRYARAQAGQLLADRATKEIKGRASILFDKNGNLKTQSELNEIKAEIRKAFAKLKIWDGIKKWAAKRDISTGSFIRQYFVNRLANVATITNIIDAGGNFFTENIYNRLNRMDDDYNAGVVEQMGKLDEIANSVDGIEDGYNGIMKLFTGKEKTYKGSNGKNITLSDGQAMRVYALSLNKNVREDLNDMGISDDVINEIKNDIGKKRVDFVDKIVDYLSNQYYESVNNVYSSVNDVNLGYVENYFPVKRVNKDALTNMLATGDFTGVFNTENSPALKERTDTNLEVDFSPGFVEVLDAHIHQMERYKSHAVGVRAMSHLFRSEAFKTYLNETGLGPALRTAIMHTISPEAGLNEATTYLDKALRKFTSFALSFKLVQIPKQASSFINAFEDYRYAKSKQNLVIDSVMFTIDMARILSNLPKYIKKAQEISPTFRRRLELGIQGDVYGLESGSRTFKRLGKGHRDIDRAIQALQKGASYPTVLGDAIGVMGYMANYERNIKNGMDPKKAAEVFNDYNATQQSRRGADKIPLQNNQTDLSKTFTMFGSTAFLQMNKVHQGMTNIMRDVSNGKTPKQKDIRAVGLNLGLANAFFIMAANMFRLGSDDEEDKEAVMQQIQDALIGLNLIYQIPLVGNTIETAIRASRGERAFANDVVNPFTSVFFKIKKSMKESEGDVTAAIRPLIEIGLGAQLDPVIGIANAFSSDAEMQEDAIYDILGIAPSYRPTKEDGSGTPVLDKQSMKKFNPKLYNRTYGPGSPYYERKKRAKEIEDRLKERINRRKSPFQK
jgi:hypothetical protein